MNTDVEYTTDATLVESVNWTIASESVADYDDAGNELDISFDVYEKRMYHALGRLHELAIARYPNCHDWYIDDGGYENQFASFGPRCNTTTGAEYEPFFDDMTEWEDKATAEAIAKYPAS